MGKWLKGGRSMTLLQLKYVLTIADCGAMNCAAERLFVSQPALTSSVHELEKEIGVKIFNRTPKGVSITSEGEIFLSYARQLYQQYELLQDRYTGSKRKRRFGVSAQHYSFVDKAFVEMVKEFDAQHYEFTLKETCTLDVIRDVGELRSEIGILYLSDYNRKVLTKLLADYGLEFSKLIECRAYVYLWKGHPLAGRESITMKELEPYPYLTFVQGNQASSFLAEEILTEREYPCKISTNDRATNLNLMVGLNAYTLCSGIICEELNGTDYAAVPFQEDEENHNSIMEIGYIKKSGFVLSEIAEVFMAKIRDYLEIG
jgi:DNA-binding transcriptional LysR family regulator